MSSEAVPALSVQSHPAINAKQTHITMCVRPESQISVICLQQSQRQTHGDKEAEEQREGSGEFSQYWLYVLLIIKISVSRVTYKTGLPKKEPKMKYINK